MTWVVYTNRGQEWRLSATTPDSEHTTNLLFTPEDAPKVAAAMSAATGDEWDAKPDD